MATRIVIANRARRPGRSRQHAAHRRTAERHFLRSVALLGFVILLLTGCATSRIGAPRAPAEATDAGVLTLPSGRNIRVLPDALHFTGQARFTWPDGRTYSGTWRDGQPDGTGIGQNPDGSLYDGQWRGGRYEGLGRLIETGGRIYEGQFAAGMRQGFGVQSGPDGIYQGQWRGDHEHGHGELTGTRGSHYTGEWVAGQRAGYGRYQGADDAAYEGDWKDDRPDGHGIYRFPDGSVYLGTWKAGLQHGSGRFLSLSGVTYDGHWRAGKRDGTGIEQRPDGGRYVGEWQADRRSGEGRQEWPDGTLHEGTWELDRPLGPGVHRYPTGIELQGAWNGSAISTGLVNLPDGAAYAGPLFRRGLTVVSPPLLDWLERTAANGSSWARLLSATAFLDHAEPTPDRDRARHWLELAAPDLPEAAFRLGLMLLEEGKPETIAAGLAWLERAGATDHPEALRTLGDLYASGRPDGLSGPALVERDEARAITLLTAALRAGSPLAAQRLASCLISANDPTLRDPERAIAVLAWRAEEDGDWLQLTTLAQAYMAAGDVPAAVATATRALAAARPLPDGTWRQPRPNPGTPVLAPQVAPAPAPPDMTELARRLDDYRSALTGAGKSTAPEQHAPATEAQQP